MCKMTLFYVTSLHVDLNEAAKCDDIIDWFHNLCMLLRADLSLIQRLVAKQCLKSDLFDSLVFIIIACLKFGPRN